MPKNENKAIKSASIVTLIRALGFYHKDAQNPDYMAILFLSRKFKFLLWLLRMIQKVSSGFLENSAPGSYWYFQARTKHIDALLTDSINSGIEQFVILGSGYDSRPYRFREELKGIQTFEVDFPGTLSVKKQKLVQLYNTLPEHITYVPIDFNSQSIKDVLFKNGYDPKKKTFFIWEGVSYYLPQESVDAVLKFVAQNSPSNSLIAFDYALSSFIEGDYRTYGSEKLAKSWENVGEPGLSGIKDGGTDSFLTERGLSVISDLGPEKLEHIYATGPDGQQLGQVWGCMRIAYASVIG